MLQNTIAVAMIAACLASTAQASGAADLMFAGRDLAAQTVVQCPAEGDGCTIKFQYS